jgi:hypothetical protein
MLMLHLVLPDKTFSRDEMRYLAQWPTFHVERVMDGSYKTRVETYFSDQFLSGILGSYSERLQSNFNKKNDLILNFGQ